jgi:hypothetical protein
VSRLRKVKHRALIAFLTLLTATHPALAQTSPADSAEQELVRRLYQDAKAAGERDDWQAAYDLMLEAWQRRRAADVAVNLGFIEMQLQKRRDAAEHLAFGLRSFPADADPELMRLNRERLARSALAGELLTDPSWVLPRAHSPNTTKPHESSSDSGALPVPDCLVTSTDPYSDSTSLPPVPTGGAGTSCSAALRAR